MAGQGGFGVILKIDVSTTLTAVTHVLEVEFPKFKKFLFESTAHDSPGGYAEWQATGKRAVEAFTCKLLWDKTDTTHAAMVTAFDSDAAVTCSVADPDGNETISFEAIVEELGRVAEQEDGYTCEVKIQPTGQPTIA